MRDGRVAFVVDDLEVQAAAVAFGRQRPADVDFAVGAIPVVGEKTRRIVVGDRAQEELDDVAPADAQVEIGARAHPGLQALGNDQFDHPEVGRLAVHFHACVLG